MKHSKALDGLRSWAVLAVMLFHSGFPGFRLGWLGVDLFFVLSGYLITTLLIEEYRSTKTIRLGYFWARRFLRLMPIYWLFAGTITALILFNPSWYTESDGHWSKAKYISSLWLYFNNYFPAGNDSWTFNQELTSHLWTLSVEEQFYFVWPPLVSWAVSRNRLVAMASLLVASSAACVLLGDNDFALRRHLYTRGNGILMGSLMAAVAATPELFEERLRLNRIPPIVCVALAVLGLGAAYGTHVLSPTKSLSDHIRSGWNLWINLSFALLIVAIVKRQESPLARLLNWKPFVRVGKISYGVYLYHVPIHFLCWHFVKPALPAGGPIAAIAIQLLYVGLSIGLAEFSYSTFEIWFLRLKNRFR